MKKASCPVCFFLFSTIVPRLIGLLTVYAGLLSLSLHAAVLSWSGGGGANAYWNNSANWGYAGTPGNGDTVVFPASQPDLLNTNNIAGLTLNQIRFVGAGGGYDIRGDAFTLTNSIIATNTTGPNIIENNITLATADVLIVVSNGVSLTLDGTLSGSVGVNKAGLGRLTYQGPVSNPYTGTTLISGGTLQLNVGGISAFEGPLVIGDGTGTGSPTIQDLQSVELENTGPITINLNGTLNLNNFSEPVNINPSLTLSGGTIETGTGTLTLSANSTITSTNGYGYIEGNLNTGSGTLTIQGFSSILYVYATVSGSANIAQNNSYTYWSGANTYTGNYTANGSGYVDLVNSLALGNTNNAMTLNGQAWVAIAGNINITNQSLTINSTFSGGTMYVYSASTISWQANFTLGSACTIDVETNCTLNLNGPISGSGGFTKIAPGTLTLSGSSANSYAGLTSVNEGELDLNKSSGSAIPPFGPGLVIGDGIHNDTVRCLNNYQIWSIVTPTTINSSGVLNVNGYTDEAAPLTLNGGQITTGSAGHFGLNSAYGAVTVLPAVATISGNVFLDGGVVITNYSDASLYIPASISGSYGITIAGAGSDYLQSSNSYTGLTVIQQGCLLWAENSWALGSSTGSGIVVSNGASLVLPGNIGITNKSLTLNGAGAASDWGALDAENTFGPTSIWNGPITVNADSTIMPYESGNVLRLLGPINGAGGVIVGSGGSVGTLSYEGSTANSYAGLTTVSSGTLVLNNSAAFGAIPGNLDIFGTVTLAQSVQTIFSADVNVESGGLFNFASFYDELDTLHGTGSVTFGTDGWLDVGFNDGSSTFNGVMSGIGFVGGYTVGKYGTGTFTMNGNNTYQNGTEVFGGTLIINGSQPQSPVLYMSTGTTLGGSGTVGTIAASGIVSPGDGPGILNSSNVTFSSTGDFTVELTGPNPGVGGYDQLNVTGTVSLASATLTVIPNFTTPVSIGQQFVIINNDLADAITGTFIGLANGAQFSTGGYTFRINYNGGTGNDVVLTLLGVPGNTVTLNAVASGWYDSTGYHNPLNPNYLAQNVSGTNTSRDWFVFNAPVFSGSIIHAELLINCYSNSSPQGQATYLLRRVTTPIATLEAGGSGLVGIYNDLGTGAVYSVRSISTNEAGQTAIIPLDVQFFNDATAASGGQIAVGGSISTAPTNMDNPYLFGYSAGLPTDIQLRLTFGTSEVINSADRGWYSNLGNHTADNQNYFVGDNGANLYRDFFVFNLPALSSQLAEAELLVNSYANVSPSGVETYQLYDVNFSGTNSITVLTNNASGATNIYADLGSGVVYGGRNVYVSESGFTASLPLNESFLGAALANSGGRIALGGALTSLNPAPTVEYLFGDSVGLPTDAQLWLGFLNAPSSHPSFVGGTPTDLGNDQFQFTVSGTTGTTNEIQGSFDFQNWDFIRDVVMTGSTTSFVYTNNTVVPYRFFRAEQLQ